MTMKHDTGFAALAVLALAAIGIAPQAKAADGTITVTVEAEPTSTELAAIKRALANDHEEEGLGMMPVTVGHADLNGDHRPDLILLTGNSALCGAAIGCATEAILATPTGYTSRTIGLAGIGESLSVLPAMHNGMHDLRSDGGDHIFKWDGKKYR